MSLHVNTATAVNVAFIGNFLATLVALHFTPVSKSLGRWVIVSDWRSFEACELVET